MDIEAVGAYDVCQLQYDDGETELIYSKLVHRDLEAEGEGLLA